MTPKEKLPPVVLEDVERYRSYRWKRAMIQELVYRRHGLRLQHCCLRALETDAPCPKSCGESPRCELCAPPVPPLELPKRKIPPQMPGINERLYDEWLDVQRRRPSSAFGRYLRNQEKEKD